MIPGIFFFSKFIKISAVLIEYDVFGFSRYLWCSIQNTSIFYFATYFLLLTLYFEWEEGINGTSNSNDTDLFFDVFDDKNIYIYIWSASS